MIQIDEITKQDLVTIMDRALVAEHGLLLQTSNFDLARARLYKARAEALDSRYGRLQFRASPFPGGNLVVCKAASPPEAV